MITQCTIENLYRTKNNEAIDLAKTFERRRCNHGVHAKRTEKVDNEQNLKKHEVDNVKNKNDNEGNDSDKESEDEKRESEDQDESKNKNNQTEHKLDGPAQPKSAFECISNVVIVNGANKHRYVVATQKTRLRSLLRRIPAIPLIYINRSVMIMEPMSPATEKVRSNIESSKLSGGLNDVQRKHALDDDEEEKPKKKRKGPKEPNPLSIKKKTKAGECNQQSSTEGKKKRRKRGKGDSKKQEAEAASNEACNEVSNEQEISVE